MENNDAKTEVLEASNDAQVSTKESVATPANKEKAKVDNKDTKKEVKKDKAKKDKGPNKMAKALKETGSELKKVSWPNFATVCKQTGIVIAVTLIFLLVILGLDRLCSFLVGLICG